MSSEENKKECEEDKKEEKKDPPLQPSLKTTTETSTLFFLSKFNSKDSYEVKFPNNFKDFDQLLKKILFNLEETENVFLNQTKFVLDRDLCLINWRFRLDALYSNLIEKKRDFERIDQTVQCIQKLTSHTDEILSKLEKELPGPSFAENAFKHSPIRMNMYHAMMKINISQRDLLQQLSSAIYSINEAIKYHPCDPVEQFTAILSLHTEVLGKIEFQTRLMEEQLETSQKLLKYLTDAKKSLGLNDYRWFDG